MVVGVGGKHGNETHREELLHSSIVHANGRRSLAKLKRARVAAQEFSRVEEKFPIREWGIDCGAKIKTSPVAGPSRSGMREMVNHGAECALEWG